MDARTNKEIIDDVFIYLSERLDKQLLTFSNILAERENLELLDENTYYYLAGSLLLLVEDDSDTSNNPVVEGEECRDTYEAERKIVLKCALTYINFELAKERKQAIRNLIDMLETTHRTFNREFTNLLYLLVLFSEDEIYSKLCPPLSKFIVQIVHNDFTKYDIKNSNVFE